MSDKHSKDLRDCMLILAAVGVILGLLAGCAGATPKPPSTEIPVHVIEKGRTVIRLMPGQCVDPRIVEIVTRGMPGIVDRLKHIESVWGMKDGSRKAFGGCWAEYKEGEADRVLMIFEDGDYFIVDKAELTKKGSEI